MIAALADHHGDAAMMTGQMVQSWCIGPDAPLRVWIAKDRGQAIGYLAAFPAYQLQMGMSWMELHHLYVDAAHRRRGIGRALIQTLETYAVENGHKAMVVKTVDGNDEAPNTYLALNFTERPFSGRRFRRLVI